MSITRNVRRKRGANRVQCTGSKGPWMFGRREDQRRLSTLSVGLYWLDHRQRRRPNWPAAVEEEASLQARCTSATLNNVHLNKPFHILVRICRSLGSDFVHHADGHEFRVSNKVHIFSFTTSAMTKWFGVCYNREVRFSSQLFIQEIIITQWTLPVPWAIYRIRLKTTK